MKIFLLTPVYATTTQGSGATPVVHYFAKEWVKQGHEVYVINLRARFPRLFYWFSKLFQHHINSRLGMLVPTECPTEDDYEVDGVTIHRRLMRKFKPHSEYKYSEIMRAVGIISNFCDRYGVPDVFIGHWHNPQLEVLTELKKKYGIKTALVLHENKFSMEKVYGDKLMPMLSQIDVIGFRNPSAKADYVSHYGEPKASFIAYSGVSANFLEAGKDFSPSFNGGVKNYVFVGSLIARKYPAAIVKALDAAYEGNVYSMTFVGDGVERDNVEDAKDNDRRGSLTFTGRIARDEVVEYLKTAQVFVMISKAEIFGLVYLEAMALGLIPIGSRNEGIDGIIQDGVNGFLCEAGNEKELEEIIKRIQTMSREELDQMSARAKQTAFDYSDTGVARRYLENLLIYESDYKKIRTKG